MSLADEVLRRARRAAFSSAARLFPQQLAVRADARRFLTVDCTRRAGKTDLAATVLLEDGLTPGAPLLYVAPTRKDAHDTVWTAAKALNDQHTLGYVANEQYLTLTHPLSGSELRFRGAKDEGQAQHLRGSVAGYRRAIVDEGQNYGGVMRTLIGDVLLPAMTAKGVRGSIWVMGTPSLVPSGFWYDLVHRSGDSWGHHRWSLKDNPHLTDIAAVMEEAARALGGVDSPAFRREWLGEWVADPSALVFALLADANYFDEPPPGKPRTIIGVDLGNHPDSSAIDVEGWFDDSPDLYGLEEWVKGNCDLEDVRDALEERIERYQPDEVVIDEGGLGKMIAETLRRRHGIACQAAEKADKVGAINVFNADVRAHRVKVRRGARSAHDMAAVRWDEKARESGQHKIAKKPHSDILDAKLYAHRRARHYLYRAPEPPQTQEQKLDAWEQEEAQRIEDRRGRAWWEAGAERQGYDV